MKNRLHPVFLSGLGCCAGFLLLTCLLLPAFAQTLNKKEIVESWSEGLGDLSEEEKELFGQMAQSKLDLPPTKGLFPPPGADSTIVANPILLDYVQMMESEKKPLEPQARALVDQTQSRFLFLETGLSIEKKRFENIDLLNFNLTYSPGQVSTYSLLPASKSRTLFTVGGETKINLEGSLNLGVGKQLTKSLGAKASAEARQGFFVEWKGSYDVETVDIASKGRNQPWSRWTFVAEDLVRDDLSFFVVLKVPQEVEAFQIKAEAIFIDKRIWPLDNSKTSKSLTYACKTTPVGCRVVDEE